MVSMLALECGSICGVMVSIGGVMVSMLASSVVALVV